MIRWFVVLACMGWLVLPAYAADRIAEKVAKLELSQAQLLKIGEAIDNAEGENTCLTCHGKGGTGGDQAGTADLRHPRTWRAYQALGGDIAFQANKAKFLNDMDTVLHYLIRNGATQWNLRFPKAHKTSALDWSQVTIPDTAEQYDQMMKGITSAPMTRKLKAVQKQLAKEGRKLTASRMRDVAAVADLMYLKTFDDGSEQGGVFKKIADPS
jgi:hypothetical protein